MESGCTHCIFVKYQRQNMMTGSELREENIAKPIHDEKKAQLRHTQSVRAPNDRDVTG
jgi:hypothetical protein